MIDKIGHYSLENHPTVYDEESLTALQLAGRTAAKVNEVVGAFNELEEDTQERLAAQDENIEHIRDVAMPSYVTEAVIRNIENGAFDEQIGRHLDNLNERVDNLLGSVAEGEGMSAGDAELMDIRTRDNGSIENNAGAAVRLIDREQTKTREDVYGKLMPYTGKLSEPGYVRLSNGNIVREANSFNTGKMPCTNMKYLRYRTNLGSDGAEGAFYNLGEDFPGVSGIAGDAATGEKIVPIPDWATEVTVSLYENPDKGVTVDTAYVELYNENFVGDTKAWQDYINDTTPRKATPTFDLVGYVGDGYIATAGYRTPLFRVDHFDTLRYRTSLDSSGIEVAFYDENRNIVADRCIYGDSVKTEKTVALANYRVGATQKIVYACVSLYEGGEVTRDNAYVMATNKVYDRMAGDFTADAPVVDVVPGKILIFGDSITETAYIDTNANVYTEGTYLNWPMHIPELLGTSNFKNYANYGAHITEFDGSREMQLLSRQIDYAIKDIDNDDTQTIVIAIGTNDNYISDYNPPNDYDSIMGYGKVTDVEFDVTMRPQNVAGWLRICLHKLRTKYPTARGYICTPIQRADVEINENLMDTITKMGNRYGFDVIDLYTTTGIVRENETWEANGTYLADGLHTNTAGKRRMAECICNHIKSRMGV